MRRSGPVLLAVGAVLMIVGVAGHLGVAWAVGVILAAAGLAVLVAARSRLAAVALAVLLIALVTDAKDRYTALDPRDGRVLVRAHTGGLNTAGPGRILLQTKRSARECRVDIVSRSDRGSARTGCGPIVGLTTRPYLDSYSGEVDTIDLRTGRAHHLAGRVSGIPPLTVGGRLLLEQRSARIAYRDRTPTEAPLSAARLTTFLFLTDRTA